MLRNELSKVCNAHGANIGEVVQACGDVMMAAICQQAPNVDVARADVNRVASEMCANIERAYVEFHDLIEARRTRQ